MKIEIKNRWNNEVIHEGDFANLCAAVADAVQKKISLWDANLGDANLGGADLRGADLRDANLGGADLRDANLGGADLRGADLRDANLGGADLRGADLRDADLRGANLGDANLNSFRRDVEHVLFRYPTEAAAVAQALRDGKVDGSVYSGECACLIGTIANAKRCPVKNLEQDASRPAEIWFMQFKPGRNAENYQPAALTVKWIEEWEAKYGPKPEAARA